MNTFFVKTFRIMMLFLFIISLALGYVIYEDTLAVWWIPVGVALLIALATLPFYRKWSWLTTTEGKVMNVLCHIGCVGAISYALFLSGNYWLAGTASIYEETVMVQKKYIETHKKTRRVRKEYYLQVAFENGNVETLHVSSAVYNKTRQGKEKVLTLQKGFFGLPVIAKGL